jgi:hypothetical protein
MLVNRRNPHSWERLFPPGPRLFAALAGNPYLPGAYGWIQHWGTCPGADRSTYADFLDEAAILLGKPGLGEAAQLFRESGQRWQAFAKALLPEDTPLLGEAGHLKDRRRRLFVEQGNAAQSEICEINARLAALREAARHDFPFSAEQAASFREGLREHVLGILDQELRAIEVLQTKMPLFNSL